MHVHTTGTLTVAEYDVHAGRTARAGTIEAKGALSGTGTVSLFDLRNRVTH